MNRGQRKWHGRIWGILFLVLPLLGFWALEPVLKQDSPEPPILLEVKEGNQKIPVQLNWEEGTQELVLEINQALESAATAVRISEDNSIPRIIGQIEGTGVYRFPLEGRPERVELVDLIKNKTLYSF